MLDVDVHCLGFAFRLCVCFGRVFGFIPIELHTGCSALYTSDVTIHDLSHPNCSTKPAWRETKGCLVQLCLIVHVSLMSIKFDDFWTNPVNAKM